MQAPRQRQGLATEARVERWLAAHGLIPIDRNVRCRLGEIDLVMRDHEGAAASIDWRKQQRLVRTAQVYLQRRFGARAWPPCRFDVVAVEEGRPRWIRAAFDLS